MAIVVLYVVVGGMKPTSFEWERGEADRESLVEWSRRLVCVERWLLAHVLRFLADEYILSSLDFDLLLTPSLCNILSDSEFFFCSSLIESVS